VPGRKEKKRTGRLLYRRVLRSLERTMHPFEEPTDTHRNQRGRIRLHLNSRGPYEVAVKPSAQQEVSLRSLRLQGGT